MKETTTQLILRLEGQLEYLNGVLERKLDRNQRSNVSRLYNAVDFRLRGIKAKKMPKPLVPQPLEILDQEIAELCTEAVKLARIACLDRIKLLEITLEAFPVGAANTKLRPMDLKYSVKPLVINVLPVPA